jgi:hypothetical protein
MSMGIGFRELIFILIMLGVMVLLVAGIVWLIGTASKPPNVTPRSASERRNTRSSGPRLFPASDGRSS